MTTSTSEPSRRERLFERPVFVVGAPGSGVGLVHRLLSGSPDVFPVEGQARRVLGGLPHLQPGARGWDSARLGVQDAKPTAVARLERWWADLRDVRPDDTPDPVDASDPTDPTDPDTTQPGDARSRRPVLGYLEGALQVPFLDAAFPRARFVYVQRDLGETLAVMLETWRSGQAVTHPDLPDWDGPAWTFPLTPQWRRLRGAPLEEVVADQWRTTTDLVMGDLARLGADRWCAVGLGDLRADPASEVSRLFSTLGLVEHDGAVDEVAGWADAPTVDRAAIEPVLARLGDTESRSREMVTRPAHHARAEDGSRLASVSTPSFAELLDKSGSSVLATTYQTGRLVIARAREGALNTHFRRMESPMGMAYADGVLSIGTKRQVTTYVDVPGAAAALPGGHDACFLPRSTQFTGDIRIHDVTWAQGELWAVATRFSCLVTFDGQSSFVPRWWPSFITKLAPEDRCHLNGLAVVDGRVKYVSALGTSDTEGGWRPTKARGGVVIDVESNEVVVSGLSMPHSPRWYRDRLWILESGEGTLATVDPVTGTHETVAVLPGFTRGLAFIGRYALIGLSEVREATTFGGIPLTSRLEERECGIWVVDIETGQIVGYLRFEDFVQEIFDVAVLPGVRFPDVLEGGHDLMLNNFLVPPQHTALFA